VDERMPLTIIAPIMSEERKKRARFGMLKYCGRCLAREAGEPGWPEVAGLAYI